FDGGEEGQRRWILRAIIDQNDFEIRIRRLSEETLDARLEQRNQIARRDDNRDPWLVVRQLVANPPEILVAGTGHLRGDSAARKMFLHSFDRSRAGVRLCVNVERRALLG